MKIFYKQQGEKQEETGLSRWGIRNCYLKKLSVRQDSGHITKKTHHHTHFELHFITEGCQVYAVGGKVYTLKKGDFLLICPGVSHKVMDSDDHTEKFSITFNFQTGAAFDCLEGKTSARMLEHMDFITHEAGLHREISPVLIENCILEMIVSVLRLSGVKEKTQSGQPEENAVIEMAKQYIDDNIENAPEVADVARYCYLSPKQLTRIFNRFEGMSPGEYIKGKRIKRIEELIHGGSLSLKEISEKMNFSSEYYFNAFFKKQAGMPPGEYRKMLGK